jgi:RNA polymerase sigma factor (sigma-70 family)
MIDSPDRTPGSIDDAGMDRLVAAAAAEDAQAWESLVRRLMPLVTSVIAEYGLAGADAADVNQTVWLRVVEWLEHLRRPAALPAWIVTTTRRECQRAVRSSRQVSPVGLFEVPVHPPGAAHPDGPEDSLLREERDQALREGFAQLAPRCRSLLEMLLAEPSTSYREIVARTGMRIGSIGPTQRRCLDRLRATPALTAYLTGRPVKGARDERS